MTLEKVSTGGSNTNFLQADDVKSANGKFICVEEPRMVETKYGSKLFVDVKPVEGAFENGDYKKTYVVNGKSQNRLIDELGSEETDWVSQPISLDGLNQVVQGSKKEVIYAEGALQ